MTDISVVLPDFDTSAYAHLLAPLERAHISTSELLCSTPSDIAKKAQIPPSGAAGLISALVERLHGDLTVEEEKPWRSISLLDDDLDIAWGGGPPAGHMTEITGESGAGKTQFLLTLLLAVQLPEPQGLSKSAIYISTEAALSTARLSQLLEVHPQLGKLSEDQKPSLKKIHSIQTPDLETQDHILRYQLPVAIERFNVGLVVIDSIASNFRAEFDDLPLTSAARVARPNNAQSMAERRNQLVQQGSYLRTLARTTGIAVVLSNQVADRFESQNAMNSFPASGISSHGIAAIDPLTLDHQQKWFTGWGELPSDHIRLAMKTPSLGLVWTNQITARIALIKESSHVEERKRRRWMRVAFASWTGQTSGRGIEYEITAEGVKSVVTSTNEIQ